MSGDVISINVGGRVFSTTKNTILRAGDGLLAKMVSSEVGVTRDSEENIFIDRNPEMFGSILEYLRTGRLYENDLSCSLDQLQDEAKYFGLTALLKTIDKKKYMKMRPSSIVSLNVGGTQFSTNMQTLMKCPDSMLAMMCNTDVPVAKDSNGAYFIDRDPEMFRFILAYLRSGYLRKLPQNYNLDDLAVEADYFGLTDLLKVVRERIDDDGSREVIIFDAGHGGYVLGPAMAIKLDNNSSQKYHFKVSVDSERFFSRDYYPYFINSMGCSLFTKWPGYEEALDYIRDGNKLRKVYLHELLASDMKSWLSQKRSVLFYVLGKPGCNNAATRNKDKEPSIKTMMETEEKVLKAWKHYFSISQERTSIVFKITQ